MALSCAKNCAIEYVDIRQCEGFCKKLICSVFHICNGDIFSIEKNEMILNGIRAGQTFVYPKCKKSGRLNLQCSCTCFPQRSIYFISKY